MVCPLPNTSNIQRLTLKPFVISKDGDEYEEEEITKIKNKLGP
jgi:hypothetical protein